MAIEGVSKRPPRGLPLSGIEAAGLERYEQGQGWFRVVAKRVRARVKHARDAFACRLGGDDGLLQVAHGEVQHGPRLNALYSPSTDAGMTFGGRGVVLRRNAHAGRYEIGATGVLDIWLSGDHMKRLGHPWYDGPVDRTQFPRPPAGWCSWYIFQKDIDEGKILRNAEWMSRELAPLGARILQIDDGWQGNSRDHSTNRDWDVVCRERFPHGMAAIAARIRELGLTPGIWVIPQAQSRDALWRWHPEMFLHREDGLSISVSDHLMPHAYIDLHERHTLWTGRYIMDPTGPEAHAELARLFHKLCHDWGFDYVKIDAQGWIVDTMAPHQKRFHDPTVTAAEGYRDELRTIRDAMGPERYLVNCTGGWESQGLCHGIRTGGDVRADAGGIRGALACTMQRLYVNRLLWWADPDVVCVREPLTVEQARTWVTLVSLTGQAFLASDDMPTLSDDRVELLRRALPVADIQPLELYQLKEKPRAVVLRTNRAGLGRWYVAGLFNWDAALNVAGEMSASDLGLSETKDGYVFFDVWAKRLIGMGVNHISVTLDPLHCRVVGIRPVRARPQVIGTSGAITQCCEELVSERWTGGVLSVATDAARSLELYIHVPADWVPRDITLPRNRVIRIRVTAGKQRTRVDFDIEEKR